MIGKRKIPREQMPWREKLPALKKNTKRDIPKKSVATVIARDIRCILCPEDAKHRIEEIHHAYYGAEANHTETRNYPEELVGLCNDHHHALHFNGGNDYRQRCKDYLEKSRKKSIQK